LVIIDNLDVLCRASSPDKANSPLIVDPDTVLPLPVADQHLDPVPWDRREILQFLSIIKHPQFSPRNRFDAFEPASPFAVEELLGLLGAKRSNHAGGVAREPLNGFRETYSQRDHGEEQRRSLLRPNLASGVPIVLL
jgi:hypothetical protein